VRLLRIIGKDRVHDRPMLAHGIMREGVMRERGVIMQSFSTMMNGT